MSMNPEDVIADLQACLTEPDPDFDFTTSKLSRTVVFTDESGTCEATFPETTDIYDTCVNVSERFPDVQIEGNFIDGDGQILAAAFVAGDGWSLRRDAWR